jgi:hypothetical protein
MFSMLAILAFVWIIALNIQDPIWRWSVAGIGTIVAFGSPGGLACLKWIFSPRFRKQHSAYRRGGPLPGGPDAPEPISIPRKEFYSWTRGAMTARHELMGTCLEGKSRLQLAGSKEINKPIEQNDIMELLQKLNDTQEKIDGEMEKILADEKNAGSTEWDQSSHAVLVAPTFQMAHSPKAIVDFTLAAINNGAKSADLVYKMMVAEMDAAVARYMVTMNAGLAQTGVAGEALLATTWR